MFTHRIEFTFGVGLDRNATPLTQEEVVDGMARIERQACAEFGGATFFDTAGIWGAPNGHIFREAGKCMVVYVTWQGHGVDERQFRRMADAIKEALRQAAVCVVANPISYGGVQ